MKEKKRLKEPIARLVFRKSEDQANLILGSCFKGQDVFKGNEVWQIEEIFGELMLRKVGESIVGETGRTSHISECSWMHSVDDILERAEKFLFLTVEEWKQYLEKEQNDKKRS